MKEVNLDIKTIFKVLLDRWIWIVAVTLASMLIAFCVTSFFVTPMYTSTSQLYVINKDVLSSESTGNTGTLTDYNYRLALVETYIKTLNFHDTKVLVLEELGKNNEAISFTQLNEYVSISSDGETEFVTVTATSPDPELSKKICDAYAKIAPDRILKLMSAGTVFELQVGQIPENPSSPNVMRNTAIGAVAGFVLVCAVIIVLSILDNTVKDGQAVCEQMNIQLLGEIPDIMETFKGGYKNGYYKYSSYSYGGGSQK